MDKAFAVLQLLDKENLLPAPFFKTMVSIAVNKAADLLSEELGYKVSATALEKECYSMVNARDQIYLTLALSAAARGVFIF